MLNGKELGRAIAQAIELKKTSGAIRSEAEVARHFGIKQPSLVDWKKRGTISKEKLPELWRYFADVVSPEHWGLEIALSEMKAVQEQNSLKTLAERLQESRSEAGLTQTALARKARLKNQSIIAGLESGYRKTSSYLPAIASVLGLKPLWLAEGRGPKTESETGYADISEVLPSDGAVFYQLDVEAACGNGRLNSDYPEIVRAIVLSDKEARERIGSLNKSGSIQVIVATGDSMLPTIRQGDLLFVDTAVKEYRGEGPYILFREHDGVVCKRLSMAGKTLMVSSDNRTVPNWKWQDRQEPDRIIGRVLAALPMDFRRFGG